MMEYMEKGMAGALWVIGFLGVMGFALFALWFTAAFMLALSRRAGTKKEKQGVRIVK